MSVYKHRNSPFWQFDFQRAGYRFSGSTEVRKSRPKREAEAVEAQECRAAERLVEALRGSGRKPLTLGAACDRWWQEIGRFGKETDLEGALAWLKAEIGPSKHLHAITGDDVAQAVAARRRHTKRSGTDERGRPLYVTIGARAINRTVPLLLRRVMRRAQKKWDAVVLREPDWSEHLLPEPKRAIRELSDADEEAIEKIEASYHAIRKLATIMGLRKREVILTWPQVDFEAAVVRVAGKGGIPRIVPMSREAYEILWGERGRDPLWVFTYVALKTHPRHRHGQGTVKGARYPITYAGLTSQHRRAWPKAGVKARFHDLRHTAGMRTLRATGNLKTTQKLLGHSEIGTTSRFYVDALVEDVRAAMEATADAQKSRKNSRSAVQTADKTLKSGG
jgi:integrase